MDLTTRYMGLQLKNPLVASASPLTENSTAEADRGRRAGVVLPSLFQEEIEAEAARYEHLTSATRKLARSRQFSETARRPIRAAPISRTRSKGLPGGRVPVIASLNGISDEGWISYAGNSSRPAPAGSNSTSISYRPI